MEAVERAFGRRLVPLGELLAIEEGTQSEDVDALLFKHVWAVSPPAPWTAPPITSGSIQQSLLIESLVRKALTEFGEDRHMLCCGYRWAGKGNFETKIAGGALEAKFPNWIVAYLKSPSWNRLLSYIGEATMRWLLWDVPVLLYRSGNAFVQLTGRPFPVLIKVRDLEQRRRLPTIPFRSILSTKASDIRTSRRVGWRLPEGHPLAPKTNMSTCVSRTLARQLALKIASIRVIGESKAVQHESKGAARLIKPWAANLHLFQRLLTNARKCPFTKLFDRAKRAYNAKLAENSEDLIVSFRRADIPKELVGQFIKSVALRIIPRPFWGARPTKRRLLKFLEQCVLNMVVGENPAWQEVLRDVSPSDFAWLHSCPNSKKQLLALQQWLLFLVDYVVGDVVRTCFTVIRDETDHAVFFTARAWESTKSTMFASELKRFEAVPATQVPTIEAILAKRRFSVPLARFVRKKRSGELRLILNMASKKAGKISPNLYLRPAFNALSCELERSPSLGGTFVQSVEIIYERYRTFILKYRREDGTLPEMFAVGMDIRKCFDTMKHDRLMRIVKSTLTSDEYAISGRSVTFLDQAQRSLRIKRVRLAQPSHADTLTSLESMKEEIGGQNRPSVLTDTLVRQYVSRDRVLEAIVDLIQGTYIRLGSKLLRMAEGVPQGSIISTVLCRIYYGAFEREVLNGTFDEREDLVMRMVDDYIMFSPSQDRIEKFKAKLSLGHESWGCFVNEEKTRTAAFSASGGGRWISWCGLRFNLKTGHVRMNYDSPDVFTPARAFQRGLGRTMRAAFAVKCRALVVDPIINSPLNILINIGQAFVVCAVRCQKFCAYASVVDPDAVTTSKVMKELKDLFIFAHALICSRTHGTCSCSFKDVQTVGFIAFEVTLHSSVSELSEEIHRRAETVRKRRSSGVAWEEIERNVIYVANVLKG